MKTRNGGVEGAARDRLIKLTHFCVNVVLPVATNWLTNVRRLKTHGPSVVWMQFAKKLISMRKCYVKQERLLYPILKVT